MRGAASGIRSWGRIAQEAGLWTAAAVGAMLAAGFALGAPVSAQIGSAQSGSLDCGDRVVPLSEGFNLVGVVEAAPARGFAARAVFGWRAESQSCVSWRAGVPASLNGLDELAAGGGAWVEAGPGEGPVALPGGAQEPRTAALAAGWNLVTWTVPDGAAAAVAFGEETFIDEMGTGSPLLAALTFDNASKRFRTYNTRLPAALIDLEALAFGQAVWLQLREASQWTIPGTGPCRVAGVPEPDPDPEPAPEPAGAFRFERTPVDLALLTSVSPPGQLRGDDYKGHGLFRLVSNETTVLMPAAAELYEGSRYLQAGEVQYLLYFRLSSGLVVLFDHVLDPSAKVRAAFEGAPAARLDDSRTYGLIPVSFEAGEVVATAVGFRGDGNAFIDFGVYDLTTPNAASLAPDFAGDRSTWRDANALCWYALFGTEAEASIRAVAGAQAQEGAASDVCVD